MAERKFHIFLKYFWGIGKKKKKSEVVTVFKVVDFLTGKFWDRKYLYFILISATYTSYLS